MRRNVKGMMAGLLTMSMLVTAPTMAFAKPANTKGDTSYTKEQETKPETKKTKAQSQKVGKVTCTASGKVNISFKRKVTYTDALKAVILDEKGQETTCKISKKSKNRMAVSVAGLVKGQKYTLKIEGILGVDSQEEVTVEKTFTAKGMKTQCKVGKTSVQAEKFVILKMKSAAYYKDATVSVKDSDGAVCDAKIVKKAKGNIKVQSYTITVNGVKTKKEKSYSSITRTITVK